MTAFLENKLIKRKTSGNLRTLKVTQNLIDFASNDYLGLSRSEKLAENVFQEWSEYEKHSTGMGSTGSRLLTGNTLYAQELEDSIATFHGYEAGVLFNCGYMANVGLIAAIANSHDAIFYDLNVHASTHDGIRISCAEGFPFRHNDLEHLEKRLKNSRVKGNRFICIESIYSTDGTKAPLQEICELSKKYDAHLIVDEAHAVGTCGPKGRGFVAAHNLTECVFAQITTFGKALGTQGAIVLGSNLLKQSLINFARSYIYTTALPFHALAVIKCSYALFPAFEKQRAHLQELIQMFRQVQINASEAPIQSIGIKGNENAINLSKYLVETGFDVRALLSPTVKQGHERLRICLHSFNTKAEVSALLKCLECQRRFNHA